MTGCMLYPHEIIFRTHMKVLVYLSYGGETAILEEQEEYASSDRRYFKDIIVATATRSDCRPSYIASEDDKCIFKSHALRTFLSPSQNYVLIDPDIMNFLPRSFPYILSDV